MNDLIVVAFDRLEDARTAMRSLRELERAGKVEFEDTAIVERMPDGKTHVRDEVSGATETGAAVGALLGAAGGRYERPGGARDGRGRRGDARPGAA